MRKKLVLLLIWFAVSALHHSALAADLFAPLKEYATGYRPVSITTGDFNSDGIIDTATANIDGYSVSILIGNGDGTFNRVDYGVGAWPGDIITGDFNGDGKLDIATANAYWWYLPIPLSFYSVSVLIGNGDGTFQPAVGYGAGHSSYGLVAGDFNGDGKVDLATTNNQWEMSDNSISVFMGNGDGTFQTSTNITTGYEPGLILTSDFDKDGKIDIVTINGDATATVLIGNGDGTFQPFSPLNVENVCGVVSGDFNGDGNIDLVVGYSGYSYISGYNSGISILLGNGDGTFQMKRDIQTAYTEYCGLAVGDFNNDRKADVTTANYVFIGNGDGTFQEGIGFYSGRWPTDVTLGDFNSDEKDDIAVPNQGTELGFGGSVAILLNIHNASPIANAGPDQTIECANSSGASVTLNGVGSSDSDGDPLTYTWTWDDGTAMGVNPTVQFPLGTTTVSLTVSDGKATATDTVNITVQDTTPPVTTATGGSGNWYNANVISTFSATDSCSGVKEIHYTINGTETVVPGSSASVVITSEGANNITYFAVDNSGNAESPNGFTVRIDKTSPTGSVIINGDAVTTTSTSVALTISATDNLSGISQMRFSNDNTNWSSWEPYNTSKNWILSNASDLMTIYVQFMDIAGNISASYSDTIYMDTDNDEIYDSVDNCPNVNNPLQEDRNGNGIGDACDGDIDGDTIVDIRDNCPATFNPDQFDSDGDGVGDVCDACINDPQNNCLNSSSFISTDITQPVTVSNFADTASVTIEPGDISTDTSITVTGETSTSNFAWGSNQQVLGAIYTFTADPPSDINSPFNSTVTITLKYDQGIMPEGRRTEQNLDIYYYDTATLTWMPQNAIQDMVNNTLISDISHFSSYYAVITTENPISDLIAAFKDVNIQDESTWENLMNQLTRAYDEYEGGDNEDVKDDLRTFINKLESGSREKIGQEAADMLIQFANEIMARL